MFDTINVQTEQVKAGAVEPSTIPKKEGKPAYGPRPKTP